MNTYLLFGPDCGSCSGIAGRIEKETDGLLVGRSLAELEIQQYLNTALPQEWEWEPMILEVSDDGQSIQVYSGVNMRLRLIQLLGIAKAWSVGSLVYGSIKPQIPVQERRTFLRYSGGLVAGLAVLGLRPMKSQLNYMIETPEGNISGRYLSGSELQEAVNEAKATREYGLFSSHLADNGYGSNGTTGFLVESEGRTPVLHVTLSFSGPPGSGGAVVRYVRHGSDVQVYMGIMQNDPNGTVSEVDVYEALSDRVSHFTTYARSGGSIIERPPNQTGIAAAAVAPAQLDEEVLVDKCVLCQVICGTVWSIGCSKGIPVICTIVCAAFSGPAAVACPAICYLVTTAICVWLSTLSCPALCRKIKFCKPRDE